MLVGRFPFGLSVPWSSCLSLFAYSLFAPLLDPRSFLVPVPSAPSAPLVPSSSALNLLLALFALPCSSLRLPFASDPTWSVRAPRSPGSPAPLGPMSVMRLLFAPGLRAIVPLPCACGACSLRFWSALVLVRTLGVRHARPSLLVRCDSDVHSPPWSLRTPLCFCSVFAARLPFVP